MDKIFKVLLLSVGVSILFCCRTKNRMVQTNEEPGKISMSYFINMRGDTIKKIIKTVEEWKGLLSGNEYHILREKGTERAYSGDLLDNKREGIYTCRGCGMPLFVSNHKFESGTGWPSFFDELDKNATEKSTDFILGYPRTELTCAKCGGHLGHLFDDGPKPTGLRYCINSISLDFIKAENKLKN